MTDPDMIIALDPGGTTGIAVWSPPRFSRTGHFWSRNQIGPCNDDIYLNEVCLYLDGCLQLIQPIVASTRVHLVCERFEFRADERYRDKIDYTAPEVIGAVRVWAYSRKPTVQLILSGASTGKGFWTDDRIKKLALWVPGQKHAMDATRHLLRYRAFKLNHTKLFDPLRNDEAAFGQSLGARVRRSDTAE